MSSASTQRVLLVHGIWNHSTWLRPLAYRLRQRGFEPAIFSYDSILQGPEAAMPALADRMAQFQPQALIGHSLGGLLALETLRWVPDPGVQRVVCLGSPLLGSATAKHMAAHRWLRHGLGRSRDWLTRGVAPWQGRAQVGMVAGSVPRGLGRLVAPLQGVHDGTVLLTETQLPGLTNHCVVACGHTELAFSEAALERVDRFLRTGLFSHK